MLTFYYLFCVLYEVSVHLLTPSCPHQDCNETLDDLQNKWKKKRPQTFIIFMICIIVIYHLV